MFDLLKEAYSEKKVFLTGHTGFKGAWMLKLLSMLGAQVRGYALAPDHPNNLYNAIDGGQFCESIIEDIRNKSELTRQLLDFQPDFVFHLAAQPLVRLSYEMPLETFEVNAVGTANLLDAVRKLKKKCQVVLITTDKVYHNNEWLYPYRETDRLGGYDPYSASKACAELVIDSYRNSFFNPNHYQQHQKAIAVGRAGNVIGGGDWAKDRLIPDVVLALSTNQTIKIRNPKSVRPWQHVLEPIVAYLILGKKLVDNPIYFNQSYNFGPFSTDVLSVEEMVDLAIGIWGNGCFIIDDIDNAPHEAGLLKLDISKAITEIGWHPKMSAEKAVQLSLKWYQEFIFNKANICSYTESQILEYLHD